MRRPAGRILEQTNRANATVRTEIEPVMRAAGHANQIAGLDLNREDRPLRRMDMKQAAAFDDEADFVFIVPVFSLAGLIGPILMHEQKPGALSVTNQTSLL